MIREAEKFDFEGLLKLHLLLYKLHQKYDPQIKIDLGLSGRWIKNKLKDRKAKIWVGEEGKEVKAYALCELEKGEVGVISEIYVNSVLRNHGLGKNLIGKAIEFFKKNGIKKVLTATPKENHKSKEFWISLGFKEVRDKPPNDRYSFYRRMILGKRLL